MHHEETLKPQISQDETLKTPVGYDEPYFKSVGRLIESQNEVLSEMQDQLNGLIDETAKEKERHTKW